MGYPVTRLHVGGALTPSPTINMMMKTEKKYDVALSFAGEDRACAEAVAEALRRRQISVFYDKYEKATLWGKNLYTYLSDLYQNQARYCAMFLSRHYAEKLWTNHERQAAQARAFSENNEYILPIRLDDTEIPGLPHTIGYLSWSQETAETIADAIAAKLDREQVYVAAPKVEVKHPTSWIDLQPLYFESFDAADADVDDPATLRRKIHSMWLPDEDDIWSSTVSGGVYVLRNNNGPTAVRYKYLRVNELDMSELPISVEVRADLTSRNFYSGAGIVYRFDRDRKFYYAFTISGGDKFVFYKRNEGGYVPLYSGRSNVIQSNQFNKLAIASNGALFNLFINDSFVKAIKDQELVSGDVGIIAIGEGNFFFDNLTIYEL